MEHIIAFTFIICCIFFIGLPIVGYSWSKHRYPLYTPSYLECLWCGTMIAGAILVVLLFFYTLFWSINTLGA